MKLKRMSGHCGTRIRRRRKRRETTRTSLDVRTSLAVRTSLDARTSLKKSTSPRTNMINMINMTNMGRRKRKRRRAVHPPPPPHLHPPAVMRSDASWELRTTLLASYDLMILSIDKMTVWL